MNIYMWLTYEIRTLSLFTVCGKTLTHCNPSGFSVQDISLTCFGQSLICTVALIPCFFNFLGSLVSLDTAELQGRSPLFLKITLYLSSVTFNLSSCTAKVTFLHRFLRMSNYSKNNEKYCGSFHTLLLFYLYLLIPVFLFSTLTVP